MADGSLQIGLSQLEEAFAGVQRLLGSAAPDGAVGEGYAGAADLVQSSSIRPDAFRATLEGQLGGILKWELAASFEQIGNGLELLEQLATITSLEPLQAFGADLLAAGETVSVGVIDLLDDALSTLRELAEQIPTEGREIAAALIDQLMKILSSLEGEEASAIRAWAQSLAELHSQLLPILAANDPDERSGALLDYFQQQLQSTLDLLGVPGARQLVESVEQLTTRWGLPDFGEFGAAITDVQEKLAALEAVAIDEDELFAAAALAAEESFATLEARLGSIVDALRRVVQTPVLRPGALADELRRKIEATLRVEVHDVHRIDDPFHALFDRVDGFIEGIDLSLLGGQIGERFQELSHAIEQLGISEIGGQLQERLGDAAEFMARLESGIGALNSAIEGQFAQRAAELRALTSRFGEFQPDGSFRYHLQDEIRNALNMARKAIAGDPTDPAAPSLAGAIEEFRGAITELLELLDGILAPVDEALEDATAAALAGIDEFRTFLDELELGNLSEQLRSQVEQIVAQLAPIDFTGLIGPIVEELQRNARKLAGINADSLNDLLRQALATALEVVIDIDFTETIAAPLREEFQQVRAIPTQALAELQRRYLEVLEVLDRLSPEHLLEPLDRAFALIEGAVGALEIDALVAPLDELHQDYLVQPLTQLRPSTLLTPVGIAFDRVSALFGEVDGAALIAPFEVQLNELKQQVDRLDPTAWTANLASSLALIRGRVEGIRPAAFLAPIAAEFDRLSEELDPFRPSALLAPAADLAQPLLELLESVQQETVTALFALFQAPLLLLEQIHPETLAARARIQLTGLLTQLDSLRLQSALNRIRGVHFDLSASMRAGGIEARIELAATLDPQRRLGPLLRAEEELRGGVADLIEALDLSALAPIYEQFRGYLLALLPPYAREALDVETFRRLMRLADPTRFLEELDTRFDALLERLVPIRPQELGAELDAAYDLLLELVGAIDLDGVLAEIEGLLQGMKESIADLRIDYIGAAIDRSMEELNALFTALDPSLFSDELDEIHAELSDLVGSVRPSLLLAGVQPRIEQVQELIGRANPGVVLGEPLGEAWESIERILADLDLPLILEPVIETLDQLEVTFESALRETETAFDRMLGAARGALRGSSTASLSF